MTIDALLAFLKERHLTVTLKFADGKHILFVKTYPNTSISNEIKHTVGIATAMYEFLNRDKDFITPVTAAFEPQPPRRTV